MKTQTRCVVIGGGIAGCSTLYHLTQDDLCLFLTDGRIEVDSNAVERTIRPIALNRKNALFAGHDAGATNWGVIASLIKTCKMNSVDPHAYLADTLIAIVSGHKQRQINNLLPWNYIK